MDMLLGDLIAFIHAQPANRRISHKDGWHGCVIGDYVRQGVASGKFPHMDQFYSLDKDAVVGRLWQETGTTTDQIAQPRLGLRPSNVHTLMDMLNLSKFSNYGEAQKWLVLNPQEKAVA